MKKLYFLLLAMFSLGTAWSQTNTFDGSTDNTWNTAANWSLNLVPTAAHDVVIPTGLTAIINVNTAVAKSLDITGTLRIGNDATNRTLTVSGNVTVNAGGVFNTQGDGGNILNITGNLVNEGVFDMRIAAATANVVFNGAANQTISGAGTTTDFNLITVNNTGVAGNDVVEITSTVFTAAPAFLTLTNGVFKVSGSFTLVNAFFGSANYTIPAIAGFWLNNADVSVAAQAGTATLDGLLRISAGVYNVGTAAGNHLEYNTGASLTLETGGTMNIASRLTGQNAADQLIFNMSGGTLRVAQVGNSNNNLASFDIANAGSSFTMSGGTIVLSNESTAASPLDYRNIAGTANITGGTVQLGLPSTPGTPSYVIGNSATANVFPSLTIVKAATSTLVTLGSPVVIRGNLSIALSTTLNVASQALTITGNTAPGTAPGNFTNNGTFTAAIQTTTFNGTAVQTIGGNSLTAFSSVTFNNAAGFTLANNAGIAGLATFTNGVITATPATNILAFGDGATSSLTPAMATSTSYVNGPVTKVGDDAFTFPIGAVNGFVPLAISAPDNVLDAFTAQYIRATPIDKENITVPGVTHISACDYWDLSETNDAGTPTTIAATFYWNANNVCPGKLYITNPATVRAVHYIGGSWSEASAAGGTGSGAAGSVVFAGLTAFSPFALGGTTIENPLPVVFANVKAYEKNNGVQVEWSNLTEKDVAFYDVERSANGNDFSSITRQLPTSNQDDKADYTAFDAAPGAGTNYYRIRAEETTGKIVYSKVLSVSLGQTGQRLTLYPNPVIGNQVNITLANLRRGQYDLRVINSSGQDIFRQKINTEGSTITQTIDLPSAIKPGVYNMVVTGADFRAIQKFVIQ